MKLSPLGALLLAACASANTTGSEPAGPCGHFEPISVLVDSDAFADVVVRDSDGRRLFEAPGHAITRSHFCWYPGMVARFILDPVDGSLGVIINAGPDPVPGGILVIKLMPVLRMSLAQMEPPEQP